MSRRWFPGRALARTGLPVWFLVIFLAAGCGGGDGGTGPDGPTAASLTAEGWDAFETGDLAAADTSFAAALDLDADFADAYTGRGWVALRGEDYDGAGQHFFTAINKDFSARDARAGRLLAEAAKDHLDTVLDEGSAFVTAQPDYVFSHDPTYSASDIRWLVARAALDAGDYETAAGQLDALTTGEVPDPEEAGFLEAALALLEELRDRV